MREESMETGEDASEGERGKSSVSPRRSGESMREYWARREMEAAWEAMKSKERPRLSCSPSKAATVRKKLGHAVSQASPEAALKSATPAKAKREEREDRAGGQGEVDHTPGLTPSSSSSASVDHERRRRMFFGPATWSAASNSTPPSPDPDPAPDPAPASVDSDSHAQLESAVDAAKKFGVGLRKRASPPPNVSVSPVSPHCNDQNLPEAVAIGRRRMEARAKKAAEAALQPSHTPSPEQSHANHNTQNTKNHSQPDDTIGPHPWRKHLRNANTRSFSPAPSPTKNETDTTPPPTAPTITTPTDTFNSPPRTEIPQQKQQLAQHHTTETQQKDTNQLTSSTCKTTQPLSKQQAPHSTTKQSTNKSPRPSPIRDDRVRRYLHSSEAKQQLHVPSPGRDHDNSSKPMPKSPPQEQTKAMHQKLQHEPTQQDQFHPLHDAKTTSECHLQDKPSVPSPSPVTITLPPNPPIMPSVTHSEVATIGVTEVAPQRAQPDRNDLSTTSHHDEQQQQQKYLKSVNASNRELPLEPQQKTFHDVHDDANYAFAPDTLNDAIHPKEQGKSPGNPSPARSTFSACSSAASTGLSSTESEHMQFMLKRMGYTLSGLTRPSQHIQEKGAESFAPRRDEEDQAPFSLDEPFTSDAQIGHGMHALPLELDRQTENRLHMSTVEPAPDDQVDGSSNAASSKTSMGAGNDEGMILPEPEMKTTDQLPTRLHDIPTVPTTVASVPNSAAPEAGDEDQQFAVFVPFLPDDVPPTPTRKAETIAVNAAPSPLSSSSIGADEPPMGQQRTTAFTAEKTPTLPTIIKPPSSFDSSSPKGYSFPSPSSNKSSPRISPALSPSTGSRDSNASLRLHKRSPNRSAAGSVAGTNGAGGGGSHSVIADHKMAAKVAVVGAIAASRFELLRGGAGGSSATGKTIAKSSSSGSSRLYQHDLSHLNIGGSFDGLLTSGKSTTSASDDRFNGPADGPTMTITHRDSVKGQEDIAQPSGVFCSSPVSDLLEACRPMHSSSKNGRRAAAGLVDRSTMSAAFAEKDSSSQSVVPGPSPTNATEEGVATLTRGAMANWEGDGTGTVGSNNIGPSGSGVSGGSPNISNQGSSGAGAAAFNLHSRTSPLGSFEEILGVEGEHYYELVDSFFSSRESNSTEGNGESFFSQIEIVDVPTLIAWINIATGTKTLPEDLPLHRELRSYLSDDVLNAIFRYVTKSVNDVLQENKMWSTQKEEIRLSPTAGRGSLYALHPSEHVTQPRHAQGGSTKEDRGPHLVAFQIPCSYSESIRVAQLFVTWMMQLSALTSLSIPTDTLESLRHRLQILQQQEQQQKATKSTPAANNVAKVSMQDVVFLNDEQYTLPILSFLRSITQMNEADSNDLMQQEENLLIGPPQLVGVGDDEGGNVRWTSSSKVLPHLRTFEESQETAIGERVSIHENVTFRCADNMKASPPPTPASARNSVCSETPKANIGGSQIRGRFVPPTPQSHRRRRVMYVYQIPPTQSPSPMEVALRNRPLILRHIIGFLGDPAVVSQFKAVSRECSIIIRRNEHKMMQDAVRAGGLSDHLRPAFWLWITLEKCRPLIPSPSLERLGHASPSRPLSLPRVGEETISDENAFCGSAQCSNKAQFRNGQANSVSFDNQGDSGIHATVSPARSSSIVCVQKPHYDFALLEQAGRQGKWHSAIAKDVSRAFGTLPPHKTKKSRQESIVRALVPSSWGGQVGNPQPDYTPSSGTRRKTGVHSCERTAGGGRQGRCASWKQNQGESSSSTVVSDWGAVSGSSSNLEDWTNGEKCKSGGGHRNGQDGAVRSSGSSAESEKEEELVLSNVLTPEIKNDLQNKLGSILHALAAAHEGVGYCQGMDYVVAHLMRVLQDTLVRRSRRAMLSPVLSHYNHSNESKSTTSKGKSTLLVEEGVFLVMHTFFTTYNLRHMYWPELRCLKRTCRVFERLIERKLPVLADHFQHHDLNVGLWALGWFQTLYLYLPSMPCATVCHMWDIWLVERSFKIFFRVGTAILFLSQPILLNHELEGMMVYLNTFPDATLLCPDILIACALQIKVTNQLLAEIEQEIVNDGGF